MEKIKENAGMQSTLKSLDTEEFIDIHFYRPIGYRWALFFYKLGVSPNTITILSIFLGVAAAICFYPSDLIVNIAGMLLLVWANSYDSADGQLARMTGKSSSLGRILDGVCGDVWFITIYLALCLRLMPFWGIWIWVLAAIAGYFHSKQASMADYYRNAHLLFLKGQSGSELSDSEILREEDRKLTWSHHFIYKLFNAFYIRYTEGQEAWAPHFRQMMKILAAKYDNEAPEWFRTAFRAKSLPLMKYTNMLSFNTRVIVLFISLLIHQPWLYFIFELTVLNGMLIYMVYTHERFCKSFCRQLLEKVS